LQSFSASVAASSPSQLAAGIRRWWPVSLVAVCALVPLAIDPWGLRPFLPPKDATLVIGTALAALLAAVAWFTASAHPASAPGGLASPAAHPQPVEKCGLNWPADPPLITLAVAFCVWTLAAPMLTATSRELHLHGAVRFTAVVGLAALVGVATAADSRWRYRIAGAFVFASVLMTVHASLQAFGRDPLEFLVGAPVQAAGRWRAFATTGNPNWTGAYLAATAPFVARVAHQWSRSARLAGLLVWPLYGAAVLATGSRLAMIALMVAGLAWWWGLRQGLGKIAPGVRRRRTPGPAIVVVLATSALLAFRFGDSLLTRWQDMGSVFGRLAQFGSALMLILNSPLTGHGLDHFQLLLPQGLQQFLPELPPTWQDQVPRTLTAHVHNDYLETAVEAGIVGAALLTMLWFLAVRRALRGSRPRGRNAEGGNEAPTARIPLEPALAASLISLAVLALGSIPLQTPATAVLFWVALALVATGRHDGDARKISVDPRAPDASPTGAHEPVVSRVARWTRRVAPGTCLLGGLALVGVSVWYGAVVAQGNRRAAQARALLTAGAYQEAEALYRRVLSGNPWDHESGMLLAAILVARDESDEALEVLDEAERWSASRDAWLVRAEALRISGRLEDAADVLDGAIRAVPDFLRAHYALGALHIALGQEAQAAAAYRRILASSQDSPAAEALKDGAREKLAEIAEGTR